MCDSKQLPYHLIFTGGFAFRLQQPQSPAPRGGVGLNDGGSSGISRDYGVGASCIDGFCGVKGAA